ncbi:MAG: hypothetical protein M3417_13135 [Actinomycetota bacterium]|nr:hypothetical protein [Actinomycetota bacterium]
MPTAAQPPDAFTRLAARLGGQLDAVRGAVDPAFVRADWAERNAELERALRPLPPRDYLRHPCVLFQMFVGERYLAHELPWVLERLGDPALLAEEAAGDPPRTALPEHGVVTSSNTVHHLHHLLRYEQVRPLAAADTVVEWGAGYGNLARLIDRLHPRRPTCVLIDTPVFSALQWLHLSLVLGEDRVVLHTEPGAPVEPGRMNILPLGHVRDLDVTADLFVSTWALNESTPAAQEHVLESGFFGAEGLLLAMHHGDPLEPAVLAAGARAQPLGAFMPGQHYFLR